VEAAQPGLRGASEWRDRAGPGVSDGAVACRDRKGLPIRGWLRWSWARSAGDRRADHGPCHIRKYPYPEGYVTYGNGGGPTEDVVRMLVRVRCRLRRPRQRLSRATSANQTRPGRPNSWPNKVCLVVSGDVPLDLKIRARAPEIAEFSGRRGTQQDVTGRDFSASRSPGHSRPRRGHISDTRCRKFGEDEVSSRETKSLVRTQFRGKPQVTDLWETAFCELRLSSDASGH